MSAVIKTTTPFTDIALLMEALTELGAEPRLVEQGQHSTSQRNRIKVGDVVTNRRDYNGQQFFRQIDERWMLFHDSDEHQGEIISRLADKRYLPVARFLTEVGKQYEIAYQEHLEMLAEQERIQLENERKQRVSAMREQAIAKARAQGYSVKESQKGNQIQLVLTRTV